MSSIFCNRLHFMFWADFCGKRHMQTCKTEIACNMSGFSALLRDAESRGGGLGWRGEAAAWGRRATEDEPVGAKLASACTYFLTLLCFCVSLSSRLSRIRATVYRAPAPRGIRTRTTAGA